MKLVCPVHRPVTEIELLEVHPAGTLKYGSYIHTMQIDTRIYLAWLTDRFTSAGQSRLYMFSQCWFSLKCFPAFFTCLLSVQEEGW